MTSVFYHFVGAGVFSEASGRLSPHEHIARTGSCLKDEETGHPHLWQDAPNFPNHLSAKFHCGVHGKEKECGPDVSFQGPSFYMFTSHNLSAQTCGDGQYPFYR